MRSYLILGSLSFLACALVSAQSADKIDFKRDVQPIYQQYCIECHGPSRQIGRREIRSQALSRFYTLEVHHE